MNSLFIYYIHNHKNHNSKYKFMGIKHLNNYLLTNCSCKSIKNTSLNYFYGKTIVVDTFIYLYKYMADGGGELLPKNIEKFILTFKKYNITPIFIFDGKPPLEKRILLEQRRVKKEEAKVKYDTILQQIEENKGVKSFELTNQLASLKKQFIRIDYEHIQSVKAIMRKHNVIYIVAPGESDQLCVEYVKTNKAWGCLSDDMDMLCHGCGYVLRNLSLQNNTVKLYILQNILQELNMTIHIFRDILVLSGTDYNTQDNHNLYDTLKWYNEYKRYCYKHNIQQKFYDWLWKNTKYIKNLDELERIHNMFI